MRESKETKGIEGESAKERMRKREICKVGERFKIEIHKPKIVSLQAIKLDGKLETKK